MRHNLAPSAIRNLLGSPTYRHFIRTWIEERSKLGRFGYSDIARNGKFASRSFPRDVALGTKRLTPRSLESFAKGMGLTGDLASYFKLLVELEEPECRRIGMTPATAERAQSTLKTRLLNRTRVAVTEAQDGIFEQEFPRVYAALGTCEAGATLDTIRARTNLALKELRSSLDRLQALGCVAKKQDRYYPRQNHVSLEKLTNAAAFRARFQKSAHRAQREIESRLDSPHSLFFTSTFSVRTCDLPALKDELRNVLLRYVDTAETPEGDRVVELMASLLE